MIRIFIFLACLAATSLAAQNNRDRISRDTTPSRTDDTERATTEVSDGLTFTNQSGEVFTVEDLAAELKSLRTSVEEALPMLEAFNQTYARTQSVVGALSGILSEALDREGSGSGDPDSGGTSEGKGSSRPVLEALDGLLGGGADGATRSGESPSAAEQRLLRNLQTLQRQLQPVDSTLESLAGAPSETPPSDDEPEDRSSRPRSSERTDGAR